MNEGPPDQPEGPPDQPEGGPPGIETLDYIKTAPDKVDYDPAKDREAIRGGVAQSLVLLLSTIIIIAYLCFLTGKKVDDVTALLEVTIPPLIGLVGAVTGFYFGSQK